MSFNPFTDAALIERFSVNGGGALAKNADGTGGVPTLTNDNVGSMVGAKGAYFAAANINGTASVAPKLIAGAYSGGTGGTLNSLLFNGSTSVLGVGVFGGTAGAATLAGLADATTGLNSGSWTFLVMYRVTATWNALFAKTVVGGAGRISMFPGQAQRTGLFTSNYLSNFVDNRVHVASFGWDATRGVLKSSIDGCSSYGLFGSVTAVDTTNPMTIGGEWTGTASNLCLGGEILEVLPFNRFLLPHEIYQSACSLADYYGLPRYDAGTDVNVLIDSNSLLGINTYFDSYSQAFGKPAPGAWSSTTPRAAIGATHSTSWGSKTTRDMITYGADIDQLMLATYAANGKPIVLYAWEWTNDLSGGVALSIQDMSSYCLYRRAFAAANGVPLKIFCPSLRDRSAATIPIASKLAFQLKMKQDAPKFCDATLDFGTHPLTSPYEGDGWGMVRWVNSDNVHYNEFDISCSFAVAGMQGARALFPAVATSATSFQALNLASTETGGTHGQRNVQGQQGLPLLLVPVGGNYTGTASVRITGGTGSDTWVSNEPDFTCAAGSDTFTMAWSGDDRGKLVFPKFGPGTGLRTVTMTIPGMAGSPFTRTITMNATAATLLFLEGPSEAGTQSAGVPSKPFRIRAGSAGNAQAGISSGAHTLTVNFVAGAGTVTWGSSGGAFSSSLSDDTFTVTPSTSGTITINVSDSGGLTTSGNSSWSTTAATEAITLTAAAVTTGQPAHRNSYAIVVTCPNIPAGNTVQVTFADSLGATFQPSNVVTLSPTRQSAAVLLQGSPGSPLATGTHSISVTNNAALGNPAATTIAVAAVSFTAAADHTSVNPGDVVTVTVTPSTTIMSDAVSITSASGTIGIGDVWLNSSAAQTITYSSPAAGTHALALASPYGTTIAPSSINVIVSGGGAPAAGAIWGGGYGQILSGGYDG